MFVSTELFQWQNRKQIELKDLEAKNVFIVQNI